MKTVENAHPEQPVEPVVVAPPHRIDGLDIARAVAILGMMAAHVLNKSVPVLGELSNGYPSTLFAVLSGVTLAILGMSYTRGQMMTRALIIAAIGVLLEPFSLTIAVVLTVIGVAQMILAPCVGWSTRRLSWVAAALFVIGPVFDALFGIQNIDFFSMYPLHAWLFYTVVGMLLARVFWSKRLLWLLPAGVVALVVRWAFSRLVSFGGDIAGHRIGEVSVEGLFTSHSGAWGDMLCTSVVAVAVIVALRSARFSLLQAMGSMALTVYTLHVLVTSLLGVVVPGGLWNSGAPASAEYYNSEEYIQRYDEFESSLDEAIAAGDSTQRFMPELKPSAQDIAVETLHVRLKHADSTDDVAKAFTAFSDDVVAAVQQRFWEETDPESSTDGGDNSSALVTTAQDAQALEQLRQRADATSDPLELARIADEAVAVLANSVRDSVGAEPDADLGWTTSPPSPNGVTPGDTSDGDVADSWTFDFGTAYAMEEPPTAFAWGIFFSQAGIALLACFFYRKRFRRGPLEALVRTIVKHPGATDTVTAQLSGGNGIMRAT